MGVLERVVDALDTATAIDTARVETDDVELGEAQFELDHAAADGDGVEARTSRAARIEEDCTMAIVGSGHPHQSDVECLTVRCVVVQRNAQRRALQYWVLGKLVSTRSPFDRALRDRVGGGCAGGVRGVRGGVVAGGCVHCCVGWNGRSIFHRHASAVAAAGGKNRHGRDDGCQCPAPRSHGRQGSSHLGCSTIRFVIRLVKWSLVNR